MAGLKSLKTVSKDKAEALTAEEVLARWGYAWKWKEVLDRPDGTIRHVEKYPVFEVVYLVGEEPHSTVRAVDEKAKYTEEQLRNLAVATVEEEIG